MLKMSLSNLKAPKNEKMYLAIKRKWPMHQIIAKRGLKGMEGIWGGWDIFQDSALSPPHLPQKYKVSFFFPAFKEVFGGVKLNAKKSVNYCSQSSAEQEYSILHNHPSIQSFWYDF